MSLAMWLHRSAGLGLLLPQASTFMLDEERVPVLKRYVRSGEFGIGG